MRDGSFHTESTQTDTRTLSTQSVAVAERSPVVRVRSYVRSGSDTTYYVRRMCDDGLVIFTSVPARSFASDTYNVLYTVGRSCERVGGPVAT